MPRIGKRTSPATAAKAAPQNKAAATAAPAAGPGSAEQVPGSLAGTPVRTRRRPVVLAAGVLLMVLGALFVWWLIGNLSTTTSVVTVRHDVAQGQKITADDLTVAEVNVPDGVSVIPGNQLSTQVGKRASTTLRAGELLAARDVTAAEVPAEGQALVALQLTKGQAPTDEINPGDTITVVGTPRSGDDPADIDAPTVTGTVHSVSKAARDGSIVIDVQVPTDQYASLLNLAATERVGVAIIPAEG